MATRTPKEGLNRRRFLAALAPVAALAAAACHGGTGDSLRSTAPDPRAAFPTEEVPQPIAVVRRLRLPVGSGPATVFRALPPPSDEKTR
jgi:hypothetical protein